jgi:hypothetical protein
MSTCSPLSDFSGVWVVTRHTRMLPDHDALELWQPMNALYVEARVARCTPGGRALRVLRYQAVRPAFSAVQSARGKEAQGSCQNRLLWGTTPNTGDGRRGCATRRR